MRRPALPGWCRCGRPAPARVARISVSTFPIRSLSSANPLIVRAAIAIPVPTIVAMIAFVSVVIVFILSCKTARGFGVAAPGLVGGGHGVEACAAELLQRDERSCGADGREAPGCAQLSSEAPRRGLDIRRSRHKPAP